MNEEITKLAIEMYESDPDSDLRSSFIGASRETGYGTDRGIAAHAAYCKEQKLAVNLARPKPGEVEAFWKMLTQPIPPGL